MVKWLINNDGLLSFDIVHCLLSRRYMKGDQYFGKFMNTLFAEKTHQDSLKNTSEYNSGLRECTKLTMNSVTGKTVEDYKKYFKLQTKEFYSSNSSEKIDKKNQINIHGVDFVKSQDKDEDLLNPYILLGVMIYSYSKRLLFEYINKLPNKSADVLGCETDSIFIYTKHLEHLKNHCTQTKDNWQMVEYPTYFGQELGCLDLEFSTNNASYLLNKKCYYMPYLKNEEQMEKLRYKGLPSKTIDKHGNTKQILNKEFYEELYTKRKITRSYQSVYKSSKNQIQIGTISQPKTINAQMIYNEYL